MLYDDFMNEAQIKTGTVWVYLGLGDGKNVRHTVTSVDNGEVTTWSEPSRNPEEGGQSWIGNINDFRRHFRQVV
jgi:hypothetical protein